jgi:hypothetical protein
MVLQTGEHWHCTNSDCGCEVLVEKGGRVDGANPVCACGAPMKKAYASPVFQYLDFLRDGEPALVLGMKRKE